MDYATTLARVEGYFDGHARETWARLTSDARVSRIRQTVREGRAAMRALMLSRLPADLTGARVLDAGCGTGAGAAALAARGAEVVAVDIAPQLVALADERLDPALRGRVTFAAGDMLADRGRFDAVLAMDSLIYYREPDLLAALHALTRRTDGPVLFTVAPRTPLLGLMWTLGRLFPRADRAPQMVPQAPGRLAREPGIARIGRVARGFYISECLEARA
jgi:magnesium-protoporphyrin O-methyltransferase